MLFASMLSHQHSRMGASDYSMYTGLQNNIPQFPLSPETGRGCRKCLGKPQGRGKKIFLTDWTLCLAGERMLY
ncbi:hypothetical protein [Legionella sp. W05-934-2]|jgi:hypothetical protein|uniref:hypothetical protein n=1 Tax=Legionella sp. W05-934-2 TaxID=1198649 RepID=UPI0034620047